MIKTGIIGCGFMGIMHASCYNILEDVKVVGVSDISIEHAEKVANLTKSEVFVNPDELINCSEIDFIDLCIPTYLHKEFILKCCNARKDVFCEKPITLNLEDLEEIIVNIKQKEVKLMIGMVLRFWPEYFEFKKIVDSKTYGKLKVLKCTRVTSLPTYGWDNWYFNADRSGGAALDLHIHDVDYIYYLLGKPKSVYSLGISDNAGLHHIYSTYKYEDTIVNAEGGWDLVKSYGFMQEIRGVFEDGTVVEYNSKTQPLIIYKEKDSELLNVKKDHINFVNTDGNISEIGGYYNEIKYWIECLQNNKYPEIVTPEDAKVSLEIVLKTIESAEREKEILL